MMLMTATTSSSSPTSSPASISPLSSWSGVGGSGGTGELSTPQMTATTSASSCDREEETGKALVLASTSLASPTRIAMAMDREESIELKNYRPSLRETKQESIGGFTIASTTSISDSFQY